MRQAALIVAFSYRAARIIRGHNIYDSRDELMPLQEMLAGMAGVLLDNHQLFLTRTTDRLGDFKWATYWFHDNDVVIGDSPFNIRINDEEYLEVKGDADLIAFLNEHVL